MGQLVSFPRAIVSRAVALAFRLCPGEFLAFFSVDRLLGFAGFLFDLTRPGEAPGAPVVFTGRSPVAFSFIGLGPLGRAVPVPELVAFLTLARLLAVADLMRGLVLPTRLRLLGSRRLFGAVT